MEATGTVNMMPVARVSVVVDIFVGQLVRHITDSEDVNAGGDKRHHAEHQNRQAVDVVVDG